MKIRTAVASLLAELERISLDHEEVTDSEVRESMHLVLNRCFVWAREQSPFPRRFAMSSRQGDSLVASALRRFLETTALPEMASSVPLGQPRLDLLQDPDVATENGSRYDDFLGHRDTPLPPDPLPERMFADAGDGEED